MCCACPGVCYVERQNGDADSTEREIQMNTGIAENYPEDYIGRRDLRPSAQLPGSGTDARVRCEFVGSDRIAVCPNVFRAREEPSLRSWIRANPRMESRGARTLKNTSTSSRGSWSHPDAYGSISTRSSGYRPRNSFSNGAKMRRAMVMGQAILMRPLGCSRWLSNNRFPPAGFGALACRSANTPCRSPS